MMLRQIIAAATVGLLIDGAAAHQTTGSTGSSVPTMASTGYSGFTTAQGTATMFNTPVGLTLQDVDQGADTIRAACKSPPVPPYTLTGKFSLTAAYGSGSDS